MGNLLKQEVVVTAEAVFDYEYCLQDEYSDPQDIFQEYEPLVRFPEKEVVSELEEYIQHHSKKDIWQYFRVKHYDEGLDQMLMLFVRREIRKEEVEKNLKRDVCQWILLGICRAEDWNEDLEYDGMIKAWYDTKIDNLPDTDWVEELRIRQAEEEKDRKIDNKERKKHERLFG